MTTLLTTGSLALPRYQPTIPQPPRYDIYGGTYPHAPYAASTDILLGKPDPNTGVDPNVNVYDPYAPVTGAGAGGTTGQIGGSGGVDWQSMIGGSYEVAQAEAMMAAQMARARDAFTGDLRQAFIDLGYTGDQSKLGNLSQYLDKDTIQAAVNNKYSSYNQIAEAQARADATNNAQLAARGILSSGQTSKSASDVLQAAEQNRYNSLRSFLQAGSQGLTHIGDVESQLAQGVMNARFAAAQRLAGMYGSGLGGGAPAAVDPYAAQGGAGNYDYSQAPLDALDWMLPSDYSGPPTTGTGPYGWGGEWPTYP